MAPVKSGLSFLLHLIGSFLFFLWCYILISMDLYLFSDPTSLQFWATGFWKIFDAVFLSCGLILAPSQYAQHHKFISGFLVIVSLVSLFFLLPGNFFLIKLFFYLIIHTLALGFICKNTRIMQILFVCFLDESTSRSSRSKLLRKKHGDDFA